MAKAKVTMGRLLNRDGTVAVDPRRCPALAQSLERGLHWRREWARVVELRAKGRGEAADRLARRLMGVKGSPMDEETKRKLREYGRTHRDEIREKQRRKRLMRRIMAAGAGASRRVRRKP